MARPRIEANCDSPLAPPPRRGAPMVRSAALAGQTSQATRMKAQLHRSITFWSGILVMGFLVTTWIDSRSNLSYLSWVNAQNSLYLEVCNHRCIFSVYYSAGPGFPGGRSRFEWTRFPAVGERAGDPFDASSDDPAEWFPKPFLRATTAVLHETGFAHWLLLLAFALPWSALLLWRARRRKRARLA
jgi:hypothetical protein